jgi:hypothetical protein
MQELIWCSSERLQIPAQITKGYPANTTQFRVDEAFKGLSNVTAEVDFPFPDCNVRPNVGKKYLVFAHREFSASGPLVSRHCDGTRLLTNAATDLGYLRRLSRIFHGSVSARILGIREHEYDGLEITAQEFDRILRSGDDDQGFFEFDHYFAW